MMNRRDIIILSGMVAAGGLDLRQGEENMFAASAHSRQHWQIGPFHRRNGGKPLLQSDPAAVFHDPISGQIAHWESSHVFNPAAIAWNKKLYVLYRAEGHGDHIGGYTSRIGLAESSDGRHFQRLEQPVCYPDVGKWKMDQWPGGCEDPRVVQTEGGVFVLTFTMWNRKVARLGVATSHDLLHWIHHGPAFRKRHHGRYVNLWSKSGSIVTRRLNGRIVATRIHGRYWMYWHTNSQIYLAHSEDLLNWSPVVDATGKPLLILAKSTAGHFDSLLTEPGPLAILTDAGIVLMYNGMSDGHMTGSLKIPARQYSAGQALFAADNPAKLLHRPEGPFFWPEKAWEKTGQYKAGTTFVEGLAWFNNRWFLFYGGADTVVGMAVA